MTSTRASATVSNDYRRPPLGRNYHRVFIATVISSLGDGVDAIGYPWLASAVTRNPILIALIAVGQRLPWLVFTLPAGVITDRVDRRKAIVLMDVIRGLITAAVAVAVLGLGRGLPRPSELHSVVGTRLGLYLTVLLASTLLGFAEVLRENSAQTIVPSIVSTENLERANARMYSAEMVSNTFAGPPLGSLMLSASFFLPFAVDAMSFFAAAGLVFLVAGEFRAERRPHVTATADMGAGRDRRDTWKAELAEGFRWLWHHPVLRPMAIILGVMNAIDSMKFATLVLYAQEVLRTTPLQFSMLMMGAAVGGVVGATLAPKISATIGSGPSLWLTLAAGAITPIPIGLSSSWVLVLVVFGFATMLGILWNVVTVAFRQSIIPDHLLGRVNSVYRFFAWGMMPIGTALGGVIVAITTPGIGRHDALRVPWFAASALAIILAVYAVPRLTTTRLETARALGIGRRTDEADNPRAVNEE